MSSQRERLQVADSSRFVVLTILNIGRLAGMSLTQFHTWIRERSPETKDLWAPDISYVNHEYRLYYAFSRFGKNTSGIALATNKTLDRSSPDYKWVDKGLVLESLATDNFNAIDPNFVLDERGRAWLSFGSFWDGIKMRRLDNNRYVVEVGCESLFSCPTRKTTRCSRTHRQACQRIGRPSRLPSLCIGVDIFISSLHGISAVVASKALTEPWSEGQNR